jgi:AcrR family transcriptional regulator
MRKKSSKLATVRRMGATQVDAQRANILDAAERCFLQRGLEHTTMADIAAQAGITRMTLYRYFRDRDPIAFEIAGRMLQRVTAVDVPEAADGDGDVQRLTRVKHFAVGMIRDFDAQRDAYRYLGMFDHLYADGYPTEELASWYKAHMAGLGMSGIILSREVPFADQVLMTMNAIMSFLQRMAARGHLLASEHGLPVTAQIDLFGEMIGIYFERLIASVPPPTARSRTRNPSKEMQQ